MTGGGPLRNGLLLLAAAGVTAACSMEIPDFVGRGGGGDGFYKLGGTPPPEPRPVALRETVAERSPHGVILRVTAEAPTQGYFAATLVPAQGGAPDKAGILSFELVASPPTVPGAVGPARTRILTAGVFLPNQSVKNLSGFRVSALGTVQTVPVPR